MVDRDEAQDRLRKIESVTDSALANLATDALYGELLVRVRELLGTDTATLLLLDSAAGQLFAVAAVGIEEEIRQGVRLPVGRGFAGGIVASRQPCVIDHVDQSTVVNPLLWEHGLRAMAGVPLIVAGEPLGVLHVGTVASRTFTEHDLDLLRMVADRLALAAHARASVVERAAAEALQRSLLPTVLPSLHGVGFAARYVPGAASGVGGDWYDVFDLPGDRVGVVMGDVVGRGLGAAVIMGRLRSALRAYALDVEDPGVVLDKLDRKAIHFEGGAMATVCYGVVDPDREQVTFALAGHPPPVFVGPDDDAAFVRGTPGPPVGLSIAKPPYARIEVALPPGAALCFYTDGLVERRDSSIDVGMDRLRAAAAVADPELMCARIMTRMIGTEPARDDVALLVMRRDPA